MERLLPKRLSALLAVEDDAKFAERLRQVAEAGARAIGKLGDLDLVKYDDAPLDGSADLSLWETVAPVVAATIADVNALLAVIARAFPANELVVEGRQLAAAEIIHRTAEELHEDVTSFGARVRDPSVVGDQWKLMAELQMVRFRFRERIGNMVFESASALGECRRHEVEPGYDEALATALVVRSTTSDLRRLMRARMQKVAEASPEDIEWNVQQVEKELTAFGRTAAWRVLRAGDKRTILEFRASLRRLLERGNVGKLDLMGELEPFVEFIDGFEQVNRREILSHHDQELVAQIGVVLERGMSASEHSERQAAFTEAVAMAQALYGRLKEFDAYLRKARRLEPASIDLDAELDEFVSLLASLMQS